MTQAQDFAGELPPLDKEQHAAAMNDTYALVRKPACFIDLTDNELLSPKSFDIAEGGRTYHVLIANLGTINPGTVLLNNHEYPNIADDYSQTYRILRALPCDVFLTSHASQFGLFSKYRPGMSYDPERFLDHGIYLRVIDRQENAFLDQLEEEKADDQAWRDHKQFKDVTRP